MGNNVIWNIDAKEFSLTRTDVSPDGSAKERVYNSDEALELIRGIHTVANGLFDVLDSFEKSAAPEFGLDADKANLSDILKIITNIMSGFYMYSDIDKTKILNDKSGIFS